MDSTLAKTPVGDEDSVNHDGDKVAGLQQQYELCVTLERRH